MAAIGKGVSGRKQQNILEINPNFFNPVFLYSLWGSSHFQSVREKKASLVLFFGNTGI